MTDFHGAAAAFFPEPHRIVPLGRSSGFSHSLFARIETADGTWCLRRWPPDYPVHRLRFIHRILRTSRANGFTGVPTLKPTVQGDTIVTIDDVRFDAQAWLPGQPLSGTAPFVGPLPNLVHRLPWACLTQVAEGLAALHASTATLHPQHPDEARPLVQSLPELRDAVARCQALLASRVSAAVAETNETILQRWSRVVPQALRLADERLKAEPAAARTVTTLCHGDLWPAHVYVTGPLFKGFVDWEHAGFSSPAADLAQLILHFNGWRARDPVTSAYEHVRPLTAADQAVLRAAALLDLVSEGTWAMCELLAQATAETSMVQAAAHQFNLETLINDLEAIVGAGGEPPR